MSLRDLFLFSLRSVIAYKMRASLTALGITIGICSVVILTSIGEGIQTYVVSEFTQFGTNILGVNPGKKTTMGIPGAIIGSVRPLTLDDAQALNRVSGVLAVVPAVQGNVQVEGNNKSRRTTLIGTGSQMPYVYKFELALGSFLPADSDGHRSRPVAVLGAKLWKELYGSKNPLGDRIRISGSRYRVLGVLKPKGEILGFDLDDSIYIPAHHSMVLFDREGLMGIDVLYSPHASTKELTKGIHRVMLARHGAEDYTIVTQERMLETLGSILAILTLSVAGIGGVSIIVGAIGILTITYIAVSERTSEIGLLRALGVEPRTILILFLSEAICVASLGGLLGLVLGISGSFILKVFIPALPIAINWYYLVLAELIAIFVGLVAGILPARKAAKMDTIEALRTE